VPSPFSGKIVELLVEDGAKVTAKQKLYKLEKGGTKAGEQSAPPPTKSEDPKKEAPSTPKTQEAATEKGLCLAKNPYSI
jgi:pyruvate/2-oxoglutarate dehydrogenase complex dihydrolipoamide acyltransferase (E2) component